MNHSNETCSDYIFVQNVRIGTIFLCHAIVYYPFYVPALIVMYRHLRTSSGAKIMIALGVIDMTLLTIVTLHISFCSIHGIMVSQSTSQVCDLTVQFFMKTTGAACTCKFVVKMAKLVFGRTCSIDIARPGTHQLP